MDLIVDPRERLDAILTGPEPAKVPVVTIEGRVFYALQAKQAEAFRQMPLREPSPEKGTYPTHVGYGGAAGGGKSYLARAAAIAACLHWPGTTHIIFRRTLPELRENHIVKFRAELDDFKGQLYTFNKNDGVAEFYNKSRLIFGYLRTDDDVFRYQGAEYDSMHFEEATHLSWFRVNWLVSNRLRATTDRSRPFAAYYSNPGNVGHAWFKRIFIEKRYDPERNEKPENYTFTQAHVWDNVELVKRDPAYVERLLRLSEPWRSWLLMGDFAAGAGSALAELDRGRHFIKPFQIPKHWPMFGSFDWGFEHPWSFGWWTCSEDGLLIKVDTVNGRRMQPTEIVERIASRVPLHRLRYVVAGHDLWAVRQAYAPNTPALVEQFAHLGMICRRAAIDRKPGLANLRKYFQWRHGGPGGTEKDPDLVLFRNPGNERAFEQLESMVLDPDDLEDVLKTDADETGEGGDDIYDETRYGAASRPWRARSSWAGLETTGWSPETLAYEAEQQRRGQLPVTAGGKSKSVILHPEFGGIY